jgi:hypothetical protein
MKDAGAGAGRKEQKKKRTREEVHEDSKADWEKSLVGRLGKNERQVDALSLGENFSVPEIRREGLEAWFKPLKGYNLKCVREFYQNHVISENEETGLPFKIKSTVGGKAILVTPNIIAKYLDYKRPESSTINYPRAEPLDPDYVRSMLYDDPLQATFPIKPSLFKENVRILNKSIHHNLYPRGKEHEPSQKSCELMAAFLDPSIVADWAHYIFGQLIDFITGTTTQARMWFPCMITQLCHNKGVKGKEYKHEEKLDPGVIDMSTVNQSRAQSRGARTRASRAAKTTAPPPDTAGPSTYTAVPSPRRPRKLYTMPPTGMRMDSWFRRLFKQNVAKLRKLDKLRRDIKWIKLSCCRTEEKVDWCIQQIESSSRARYEPRRVVEMASSEEYDEEDDDDDAE